MPKLSVIITTYDQPEITIAHLKGCMDSTRIPDEIVVVNDGGLDIPFDRLDIKCPIIYAKITEDIKWNQNGARNLGVYLSTGYYIMLEDNDHIPQKDFYKQALDLITQYDRVIVKKRLVVSEDDISKPISEWNILKTRGTADIISLQSRNSLLDIKGFDEQFCGKYGWDVPDFSERIKLVAPNLTSVGEYYVINSLSNKEGRDYWNNGITKMAPENYHTYKRNSRNKTKQSQKGILNFNYTIQRLCENLFQPTKTI